MQRPVTFVTRGGSNELHGGSKAWRDLLEAARRAGCRTCILPWKGARYLLALAGLRLPPHSVIILPYPNLPSIRRRRAAGHVATLTEMGLLASKKLLRSLRVIAYVYDLPIEQQEAVEGIRPSGLSRLEERWLMRMADMVGVVGARMEDMLARRNPGIRGKCIYYEFIPYYAPLYRKTQPLGRSRNIACVGNLQRSRMEKALLSLPVADGVQYTFYGPDGDWLVDARPDFNYAGAFPAEELSAIVGSEADFGLILYDVTSPSMTAYLSMTTTSKLFCYINAGVPILTYRYEHIAELVTMHGLGYVFDEPADLLRVALGVTSTEHAQTASRVTAFAESLVRVDSFARFVGRAAAAQVGGRE